MCILWWTRRTHLRLCKLLADAPSAVPRHSGNLDDDVLQRLGQLMHDSRTTFEWSCEELDAARAHGRLGRMGVGLPLLVGAQPVHQDIPASRPRGERSARSARRLDSTVRCGACLRCTPVDVALIRDDLQCTNSIEEGREVATCMYVCRTVCIIQGKREWVIVH
ncbi:hypothetical protein B0H13DRAFT_268026 [Mycena leptocephala]|nr:hypothetical protein B0H13DRAFT_919089 [Mycena leptocephala]KAJ7918988.1 hypothetical protein B0H13DRAFT_268026 [Mycena leptocephala]